MIIIEQIKAEIERLYDGEAPKHDQQCDFDDGYFTGIGAIAKFLDTLESEKPMEQEKEVKPCHRTRKRLAEWSKTPEGRESYEKVAKEMRKKIIPNDLEEAAEISFDEAYALTEDYSDFLAKGLKENQPRPIGPHWFCEYAKNRFIAGAKWQKEQMMKEAVEGEYDFYPAAVYLDVPIPRMNHGDKVRIIIVKED